jgi:hypothetical protein
MLSPYPVVPLILRKQLLCQIENYEIAGVVDLHNNGCLYHPASGKKVDKGVLKGFEILLLSSQPAWVFLEWGDQVSII